MDKTVPTENRPKWNDQTSLIRKRPQGGTQGGQYKMYVKRWTTAKEWRGHKRPKTSFWHKKRAALKDEWLATSVLFRWTSNAMSRRRNAATKGGIVCDGRLCPSMVNALVKWSVLVSYLSLHCNPSIYVTFNFIWIFLLNVTSQWLNFRLRQ